MRTAQDSTSTHKSGCTPILGDTLRMAIETRKGWGMNELRLRTLRPDDHNILLSLGYNVASDTNEWVVTWEKNPHRCPDCGANIEIGS